MGHGVDPPYLGHITTVNRQYLSALSTRNESSRPGEIRQEAALQSHDNPIVWKVQMVRGRSYNWLMSTSRVLCIYCEVATMLQEVGRVRHVRNA